MENKLTIEEIKSLIERFPNSTISNMANEILEFRDGKQWLDIVTKPIEPNPHAALIAQCNRDRVDYPDFWEKLYQYSYINDEKWWDFKKWDLFISFKTYKYRQHPHRARIIEFHQCSDEEKKRWQWLFKSDITKRTEWINLNGKTPDWFDDVEYRIRPRTCKVTLQDGTVIEYPEPVREQLEIGQRYFIIELLTGKVVYDHWANDQIDIKRLNNSVAHLTVLAAHKHLEVLQAVNAQVAL